MTMWNPAPLPGCLWGVALGPFHPLSAGCDEIQMDDRPRGQTGNTPASFSSAGGTVLRNYAIPHTITDERGADLLMRGLGSSGELRGPLDLMPQK